MRAKYILIGGILAALAISTVATVPYVLAWSSYNAESGKSYFVAVKGKTGSGYLPTSMATISLVAVYPKAAAFGYYSHTGVTVCMFYLQLVFFVQLDPQVYSFVPDLTGGIYFGSYASPTMIGVAPDVRFSNFSRLSDNGNIAPYFVNYSIPVGGNQWPQTVTLSYLVGSEQVYPVIFLNAAVRTVSNQTNNFMVFDFTSGFRDCPITVYFFNYPSTLWVAYGSSIIIAALASINYFLSRKRENQGDRPQRAPATLS